VENIFNAEKGELKYISGGSRAMTKAAYFFLIIVIGALVVFGCSQASPVIPTLQPAADRTTDSDEHMLWGYYRFYIDPAGATVSIIPVRQVEKHYNVKTFLNPPNCNDCITIQPTGPYNNQIIPLDITLKNPEAVTGYDVRGILLSDDAGAYLNNPDSYTGLFDNGGLVNINPFKAYAKTETDRAFGPGASFTEHYDIFLSTFGKVAVVDYAVDASWPSRAKEPYDLKFSYSYGALDNYGYQTITIGVEVHADNDDVDEVLIDCSSMGFAQDILFMQTTATEFWEASFENTPLAGTGNYECLLKASTESSAKYLYNYVEITVIEGNPPKSLQNDIQPIFDDNCILCHQSTLPPLGLDLTEGNAYSNTVNVDSEQSSFKRIAPDVAMDSYLVGKIVGIHQFLPFLGSGDRMPKNGPPYLSTDEIQLIKDWIDQGALDN
jgi:hypothetical protein